ncbi:fibrous sheath CABYR-binding protein [Teleopsis dalmanni]|uniref:fibrous sheath CABYR-binding protein n=1 Tax=Teleopsis dalmanni TaxID=139649 RepID=UPI0018CF58D1|nr:fibrous sheath CABYR-binding protein [Teleopsis dalmanni]
MKIILVTLCLVAASNAAYVPINYRNARDVSHLNLEYLPPVRTPTREYLPPVTSSAATKINNEYLPPVEEPTPTTTISNEYLPPVEETTAAVVKVSNEYLPPTEAEEVAVAEEPTEIVNKDAAAEDEEPAVETEPTVETEAPTVAVSDEEEAPVETAVLAADGYHYRKPAVVPDLSPAASYLPPVTDNSVSADVPVENSQVLANDGYRYRVVRRFRY